MRSIFALALLSAIVAAQPEDDKNFVEFVAKNNKSYGNSAEYAQRKANWKGATWKVAELNSIDSDATFVVNFTADLDDAEYSAMLGLVEGADSGARMLADYDHENHGRALQDMTIDWSTLHGSGHLFPVKDQGQCGSCWAFAATGAMEGSESIKASAAAGSLVAPVRLSEQEFVDCTTATTANQTMFGKTYGTGGCNGGWMANAWNYARDQGIATDAAYPYTGTDDVCKHDAANVVSRAGARGQITTSVQDVIAQMQLSPMTIALAAGNNQFRYYKSGILTTADGCPTILDHAILLVGYGVEASTDEVVVTETKTTCRNATRSEKRSQTCSGGAVYNTSTRKCCTSTTTTTTTPSGTETPYWNAQNQWGTNWGDQGFIKFAAEGGIGVCGINQVIEFIAVQ